MNEPVTFRDGLTPIGLVADGRFSTGDRSIECDSVLAPPRVFKPNISSQIIGYSTNPIAGISGWR